MAELLIRISGDIKNYEEALDKAEKETESLSDALSSVAEKSAIAFAALTAEIGLSVAAYKESELAINKLSSALQAQGIYSKTLVESYQRQATELQALTGYSDEAIIAAQTSVQAYVGQTAVTKELTTAIADLSAAKGMDLQSTAELIGKGIEGHTMALKKEGIEIDENLTKQQRIQQIIEKVTLSYGGQAEAMGKGLGALNVLKESFNDFQEGLGKRFAPIIETVARKLTEFFDIFANNPKLLDLAAGLLGAAAAMTGTVAVLGGLTVAAIAASAAMSALGIATIAALAPYIAVAAALTAVAGAIGYFATRSETAVPASEALGNKIKSLNDDIEDLNKTMAANKAQGAPDYIQEQLKKRIDAKKNQVDKLEQQLEREVLLEEKARAASAKFDQSGAQKAAADKAAAEAKRREDAQVASRKAANEALRLEAERGSSELIAIEQRKAELYAKIATETNAANRAAIQEKINDTLVLEEAAREDYIKKNEEYQASVLETNRQYQQLSDDEKEIYITQNQQRDQDARMTEQQARIQAAQDEQTFQNKAHNDFLVNQAKFGTAYAAINQAMNSAVVQGSAKAFGELAQLQQSSNATLKGIGKVAAIANIIIKTAESAMNIYAGFSIIPIIGPALGVAGAAAAIAFGAEQVGKVNAAAEGGLLQGGIPGVDSIPVLAQQGELVVPRQNFDEVVSSVANQRNGNPAQPQQATGPIEIVLTLKDNLMEFIEAQTNERTALGLSVRARA